LLLACKQQRHHGVGLQALGAAQPGGRTCRLRSHSPAGQGPGNELLAAEELLPARRWSHLGRLAVRPPGQAASRHPAHVLLARNPGPAIALSLDGFSSFHA